MTSKISLFCAGTMAAALFFAWAVPGQCKAQGQEKAVPLKVSFTVDQTNLLRQQDTLCQVSLTHEGSKPIRLALSKSDVTQPILRVISTGTGIEKFYRREPWRNGTGEAPLLLSPGEKIDQEFFLLEIAPNLPAGNYRISVLWEYGQGASKTAESNPVSITISPSVPENLTLVDAVGGRGGYKYGVWLDQGTDPSAIFQGKFLLAGNGGIQDIVLVSPAPENSIPQLSAPIPGTPMQSHWVAWIQDKALHWTRVSRDLMVLPIQKTNLSEGQWEIIPPLQGGENTASGKTNQGEILLCGNDKKDQSFRLQSIYLLKDKARPDKNIKLHGPKPVWIMAHGTESGKKHLTYLQAKGKKLSLCSLAWPGNNTPMDVPTRLYTATGLFVTATAQMDSKANIYGAMLIQDNQDPSKLELINWFLPQGGRFELKEKKAMVWLDDQAVVKATMAMGDIHTTALTITDKNGEIFVHDRGKGFRRIRIDGISSQDLWLHGIGFLNGHGDPVLIINAKGIGFKILNFDGSAMEQQSSPKEQTNKGQNKS